MKTVRILAGILTLALLAGCYMVTDQGSASVGIELPEQSTGSTLDGEVPDLTRVYVINGGSLIPVGETTAYKEIGSLNESGDRITEVSVGPVPAGDGYEIVVVFGDTDEGTGVFVPVEYAMTSEPFAVAAGQATLTPELTRVASPFAPVDPDDTLGEELLGIVFTGDGLFTATADTIYAGSVSDLDGAVDFADGGTALPDSPKNYTANSITLGAHRDYESTPWLNTDNGILPFHPDYTGGPGGSGFFTGFDNRGNVAGYDPDERDWNVLDSGAFVYTNPLVPDFDGDVFGYFQFDGGLGGVWDDDGTLKWMSPADMQDLVTGQPILDLDVQLNGTVNAFIASKLGAFLMPQTLLTEEPAGDLSPAQRVLDESTFFEVTIDDDPATITHVSIGSVSDPKLYLGTPRGAVSISAGAVGPQQDDVEPITGTLVPYTAGQAVVELTSVGGSVVVLTRHFLVYSTDGGENYTRLPMYASSVGAVTDMLVDPASGVILITGSQGMVGISME